MSNRKNLPGLALMAVLCIAMVALGIWGFASGNSVQLSAAELAVPTATEAPAEEEAAADEAAAAEDGAAAADEAELEEVAETETVADLRESAIAERLAEEN